MEKFIKKFRMETVWKHFLQKIEFEE